MMLGSHNSWSYLKPLKWWMYLIRFTAKCQSHSIRKQYLEDGVRCFDLRIKFVNDILRIAHGKIIYKYSLSDLKEDLKWLNDQGDVWIRVLHEVRTEEEYTTRNKLHFTGFCSQVIEDYPNIHWWCGRNLFNWQFDYFFADVPYCEEKYASVCPPKKWDDWWPWLYAVRKNHSILSKGTVKDILLIDYVNIK